MCQLSVRYYKEKQIIGSLGYRLGDYEKNNFAIIYSTIAVIVFIVS